MIRPLIILAACLLCACAFVRTNENEPLVQAELQALVPGTTTAREVVEHLGAPTEVVQLGRRSAYLYQFTGSKRAVLFLLVLGFYNDDTRSDRVWVFFDEDQVLSHVGSTFQGEEVEYAMPWEDLYD
jgi:outer membrane protein assembly factor BamE (lipoprotein component of BamABCDE complex)